MTTMLVVLGVLLLCVFGVVCHYAGYSKGYEDGCADAHCEF